jgi:hypothetical protein
MEGRLEVASNGLEQLATGRELHSGQYEVRDDRRAHPFIAAHLHHVCASGWVFGVSVEGISAVGGNIRGERKGSRTPSCQGNVADSSALLRPTGDAPRMRSASARDAVPAIVRASPYRTTAYIELG